MNENHQQSRTSVNLFTRKSRFNEMFGNLYTEGENGDCLQKGTLPVKTITQVKYKKDHIKYIDISSLDNINGQISDFSELSISDKPSRAQQKIEKGDVLVSMVRPNLKNVAMLNLDGDEFVGTTGFCVLRANRDKLNPFFILHLVNNDQFATYLLNFVNGASYPAVTSHAILSFRFIYPPITKQDQFGEFAQLIDKSKFVVHSKYFL
jgi:restriction endonuclease S subunit